MRVTRKDRSNIEKINQHITVARKPFKERKLITILYLITLALFTLLGIALIVMMFTHDSIINFYSTLVLSNLSSLGLFTIIVFFVYNLAHKKLLNNNTRKFELVNNVSTKQIITSVLTLLSCALLLVFSIISSVEHFKDIPYALNSNYAITEGLCTQSMSIYGKDTHLAIIIDNISLSTSIGYKKFIYTGNVYKVEYLPNTKEVIHIYKKITQNPTSQ